MRHQRDETSRQSARKEKDCLGRASRHPGKLDDPREVDGYRNEGKASPKSISRSMASTM
jgi:hypothetical protein